MSSRFPVLVNFAALTLFAYGCGGPIDDPPSSDAGKSDGTISTTSGQGGTGGSGSTGTGGQGGRSGAGGNGGANTTGTGGASSKDGGGTGTGGTGTGGATTGSGGSAGGAGKGGAAGSSNGGSAGTGGTGAAGGSGKDAGSADSGTQVPLDCGPIGIAVEGHGPPANRINYVIVGDCYSQADIDSGLYLAHVNKMLNDPTRKAGAVGRFTEAQQPYLRYRNFVNICALKTVSVDSVCGTATKNTAFDGYGNDGTRLGYINNTKVNSAIKANLPASITVDWKAVVLNDASWWNSGGIPMVWSGGHVDAALAAQHEGGHGFHQLADEYGGTETAPGSEPREINVTINATSTGNKWTNWLNTTQSPGTGVQGAFEGARYCDKGVYRPSKDSIMNSLWGIVLHEFDFARTGRAQHVRARHPHRRIDAHDRDDPASPERESDRPGRRKSRLVGRRRGCGE